MEYVKNKIWFSIALLFLAISVTYIVSKYEGIIGLIGKSILLYLPMHLIYSTVLSIKSQIGEYKKSQRFEELFSILISIGGITFLMLCLIELIRNYRLF